MDSLRVEIETTEVEVDLGFEALFVPETAGVALELLDHGVETLSAGVGGASNRGCQDPFEMGLDRSRELLDWIEP